MTIIIIFFSSSGILTNQFLLRSTKVHFAPVWWGKVDHLNNFYFNSRKKFIYLVKHEYYLIFQKVKREHWIIHFLKYN